MAGIYPNIQAVSSSYSLNFIQLFASEQSIGILMPSSPNKNNVKDNFSFLSLSSFIEKIETISS